MRYTIHFSCESNVGKCRAINQDNFICNGKYMRQDESTVCYKLSGSFSNEEPGILGVFDGIGGEAHGEIASLIAAAAASQMTPGENPVQQVRDLCFIANDRICDFARENQTGSMGTTGAMLVFSQKEIALCNIGDSKIFRFDNNKLKQISVDHYGFAAYGRKAPLSQYLGIPATELIIEPYMARGIYSDGDIFLICSDGLTDMVSVPEIEEILSIMDIEEAREELVLTALENGGKDNITVILCKIEREKRSVLRKIFG